MQGSFTWLLGRLLQTAIVLWIIVTILFLMFRLMPGNPLTAYIDTTFTAEQAAAITREFGLDQPMPIQYLNYWRELFTGNLGRSFSYRQPVSKLLMDVFPNTILLTGTALFIAYVIGVINGIILAYRRKTKTEAVGLTAVLVTRAAPEFWVGLILLSIFSFQLGWFPSSGATSPGETYLTEMDKFTSTDFWWHLALPMVTLAIYLQGLPSLLMRASMLEVMEEDFVTLARMKGLPEWIVLVRHAARNALLPVLTALALGVGYAVGGNVVIENVFGWPGLGRLLVRAVSAKDYPLAQGAFMLIAFIMVIMNLVADLLYGALDPRVRSGGLNER